MLVLAETTDSIEVELAGAVATTQADCVASWRDVTLSPTYLPGKSVTVTNDSTPVTAVASPGASTTRVIDLLSIYNRDTANIYVTVKYNANGTKYYLESHLVEPGQALVYINEQGWVVTGNSYMPLKTFTLHGDATANWVFTNSPTAERFAVNATRNIFSVDLEGYSQVRVRANQQVASASVNTPTFRVRYFTSYSTTFANYLQLGSTGHVEFSLTSVGYKDTGWVDLASGARAVGIYIACCELGGDAAADPALGATDILFR